MEPDSWLALVIAVLCLALIALNAAVETALTNISRLRLRQLLERGVRRASAINDLLDNPQSIPSAFRVVNTICVLTIGALSLYASSHFISWWAHPLAVVVAAFLVLIFGVAVPKAVAMRNPEAAAITLYSPSNFVRNIAGPAVWIASAAARPFVRIIGGRTAPAGPFITQEEVRMLMSVGEEEGVIQQEEEDLIHSIFQFGDTVVREVMVPRPYMTAIDAVSTIDHAADIALQTGHTRLPIYQESIDNVVGVATIPDILRALRQDQGSLAVTNVMRPVHYVPESKKVDELMRELQKGRMHMTIVVDEYGGTAGLVTIEDLLEEIVGEIQDEYDVEPPMIEVVGPEQVNVDARVSLDDINDLLKVNWRAEDSDTIGGFVYEELGRIPNPGDKVQVGHFVITVLSTEGTRINQLSIIHEQPPTEQGAPPQDTLDDVPSGAS